MKWNALQAGWKHSHIMGSCNQAGSSSKEEQSMLHNRSSSSSGSNFLALETLQPKLISLPGYLPPTSLLYASQSCSNACCSMQSSCTHTRLHPKTESSAWKRQLKKLQLLPQLLLK
jgi:hypothetical protein